MTDKLTHQAAIELLRELTTGRAALAPYTVAERVTAILDRSTLAELDPTEYLQGKGLHGYALARLMGSFSTRLVALFTAAHGTPPLKRLRLINGAMRPVCAYLELDRAIFDRAWSEALASHDTTGANVDGIMGEHLMEPA